MTDPAVTDPPRGGVVLMVRRRWLGPALILVVMMALLIGVTGYRVYVRPRVDVLTATAPVDAVVAVGGLVETAMYAQTLVQQGAAPVLVLSDPYAPDVAPEVHQACASRPAGYRIICFTPDPGTTRGEAREVRALATAHGWTRVAVVAPTFHISRTRLLVERCYPGTLLMLALPEPVPWYSWTYQYVRQTAGYAKAAAWRSC